MKLADLQSWLREEPGDVAEIIEQARKELEQATRLGSEPGRAPMYQQAQQARAASMQEFIDSVQGTKPFSHESAYASYKDWERLKKERREMRDPAFRKWLSRTSPELASWLDAEQPIPQSTDNPKTPGSSNRPEDY